MAKKGKKFLEAQKLVDRTTAYILRDKCDFLVQLPMVGHVTSLNASVAASILMYEVHRTRHPLGE